MNDWLLVNEYAKTHAKRFDLSLKWIKPYLKENVRVLELGGESSFTPILRAACPSAEVIFSTGDLKNGIPDTDGQHFDLILCMEVIEHIHDREPTMHEWHGTGASAMLQDALYKCAKPDGRLFLTTPNPCSITGIHHVMAHHPPMIYRPHVREYAPYELDVIVRASGWKIVARESFDVWMNAITNMQHQLISQFLSKSGQSNELRGEDIFLLASP